MEPDPTTPGSYDLPASFLALIDLYASDRSLERVSVQRYLSTTATFGTPRLFVQMGKTCRVRPVPEAPGALMLHHYAKEPKLEVETAVNEWSEGFSDVLVYCAAIFAAHHFEDERLQSFTQQYDILASEVMEQALREDFSGPMRIAPVSAWPSED